MKLRNKKTGIVGELHFEPDKEYHFTVATEDPADVMIYKKLADLYADWEDYEEPKEYWFIDYDGGIIPFDRRKETATDRLMKSIGNYFETKEEAEKAVKKLKAWKRLKDKGFRFKCWEYDDRYAMEMPCILIRAKKIRDCEEYLDLLFGGEE